MAELPEHPTWDDCVEDLFSTPYWVPGDARAVGEGWRTCMRGYGVLIDQYESVVQWSVIIYDFLYSRFMPLT
jgi:hypothetical protein